MNKSEIVILHVFKDEKFFDPTSEHYDSLENVRNLYYLYTPDNQYKFKYIKYKEKVILIFDPKEYHRLFSSKEIDVILFHSLRPQFIMLFRYIDKQKIVIWWSWGGDLYNKIFKELSPLVHVDLYKPLTEQYIKHEYRKKRTGGIIPLLLKIKHWYYQRKAIGRIDYFIPCLPIEHKLLCKQQPRFRAKLFPNPYRIRDFPFVSHQKPGNILVGNSLTYSNNHLDIFKVIRNISIKEGRKFVIPVNYGWGDAFGNNPENLIGISGMNPESVIWLKEYLDRETYFKLFSKMTHAVFGVLRQQALGNIRKCLREGIKVYLYRDSIVAEELRREGYVFYTIEDDLNEESLNECLSLQDAMHNYTLGMSYYDGHLLKEVEKELQAIMNNKKT